MKAPADDVLLLAQRAAAGLAERGVQRGDTVCVAAGNSVELVAVVDACLRQGIAPAMVSGKATEREIAEMSGDVSARAVLRDEDVLALTRHGDLVELNGLPACRPLHFTSGTSGRPKAVWSRWLEPHLAQEWIADECSAWNINGSDTHIVCGPLSHSAPLRFTLMTLWAGGSLAVPPAFDPHTTVTLLADATTTFMAPTHLQRLMDSAGGAHVDHSLRLLAHAGAACPDRVRAWAHAAFGSDVVTEFYGSTEGQFTRCSADDWRTHPGSVGRPRPGREMRVDDEGRLWSKAPEFARFEYWGDPEKTAQAWDGDWFTVGDYGRIDDDGYVYLEGRKGDLIITGGVNVYPAEIERVLVNLPGVDQVVAFGLPDNEWGQRVCVAIAGSVTQNAVATFAREQLSGPKRPKSVFIVENLPLTHSGKVDRTAVPALFT